LRRVDDINDYAWLTNFAVFDSEKKEVTMIDLSVSYERFDDARLRGNDPTSTLPQFLKVPPHLRIGKF